MDRIYLLNDNQRLVPMTQADYISEDLLQTLLADYPDLLTPDKIGTEPRRWLLISRETGVPDQEDGLYGRWALDHLFLDHRQIFFRQVSGSDEIVKETVPRIFHQRRPDAELRAGEQIQHGRREQMRGRMAIERQRLRVVGRDHLYRGIPFERKREIDQPPIHLGREGLLHHALRQRRLRELPHRRAGRHTALGSIGEGDSDGGQGALKSEVRSQKSEVSSEASSEVSSEVSLEVG